MNKPNELSSDIRPRQEPITGTGWQPIATAPKDGALIVFWQAQHEPRVGNWFEPMGNERGWWVSSCLRCEPTHWMPLPPPPDGNSNLRMSNDPKDLE